MSTCAPKLQAKLKSYVDRARTAMRHGDCHEARSLAREAVGLEADVMCVFDRKTAELARRTALESKRCGGLGGARRRRRRRR